MIIWSGSGGLISLLLIVLCFVASQLTINGVMEDDRYYQTHRWPKLVAFLLSALATWIFARMRNRPSKRFLPNSTTGIPVVEQPSGEHSLFFVPIRWLWVPLVIVGIVYSLK